MDARSYARGHDRLTRTYTGQGYHNHIGYRAQDLLTGRVELIRPGASLGYIDWSTLSNQGTRLRLWSGLGSGLASASSTQGTRLSIKWCRPSGTHRAEPPERRSQKGLPGGSGSRPWSQVHALNTAARPSLSGLVRVATYKIGVQELHLCRVLPAVGFQG